MKKSILVLLSIIVMAGTISSAPAKSTSNSSLASSIRLYKSGNYTQAYNAFNNIVKKDPSNAVAYYYLAMSSAQIGKKDEAIENYARVIDLSSNRQLTQYATKGKRCLESPDKCNEPETQESEIDKFIHSKFGSGFSNEARSEYEKKKIENIMREMNRGEVEPNKFKNYKDFSSEVPTNDEIVAAMRTLQRAGLTGYMSNQYNSDLSLLTGKNNSYQLLNLLTGNNNNVDPQIIQSLLNSQMNVGF